MSDLKADLESLRRSEAPETSRKGLWILLGVVILALGGGALAWRSANAAVEVATVTPSVERTSSAPAGTPVLTASGYIVARREAIVSSKIQGRLPKLRVEEGSQVREGETDCQARKLGLRRQRRACAGAGAAGHGLAELGRRRPFSAPRPTWLKRAVNWASPNGSSPTSSCPSISSTPTRAA